MMLPVTIDQEFANLCRVLTAEEKAQLEENLKKHGCQDALKVWGSTLLDGHNRHEICARLGLSYRIEQVSEIHDRRDAVNWIIANQLGRRNLIPEDAAYLRGKRYETEKLTVEKVASLAGQAIRLGDQNDREALGRDATAKRLGAEFGVGSATVKRDAAFAVAVDTISERLGKQEADLIRTGKSGLTKKAVVEFAKDEDMTLQKFNDLRFEEQRRKEKARKERKKSAPKAPPLTAFKKSENALHITQIDRMRPFMNAIIQIATAPVTAVTLASYRWPDTWRKQTDESLPQAIAYLTAFAEAFATPPPSTEKDAQDGYEAKVS